MRALYLLVLCLTLSGCVVTKEVYGPDGSPAYTLNCSDDYGTSWDSCYKKAGEICGVRGYEVIEKTSEKEASGAFREGTFGEFGGFSMGSQRVMMIQCKDEPEPIM